MAKIDGLKSLLDKLKKREASANEMNVSVIVGYTANYALHVHENVAMKWRGYPRDRSVRLSKDGHAVTGHTAGKKKGLFWGPNGQAKFLEQPFREMASLLSNQITGCLKKGMTMTQALLIAGLRLQRASQKLVPIDTGNLKNSAFTRVEK